jgi:Glycosyl hydrolase family 79 C-terminal beta domain
MNCIDRRHFLSSLAGLFGIGALSPELQGAGNDENELSVDFSAPGYLIPENFLGLSFDTIGLLLDGILLPENRSFISLVRRLGTKGVIRIGGSSSDHASLRMGLTIQRTHIEHLAAFLSATGWQLIYGLDVGSGKPEQAAAEAEMVAQIVGLRLLAFQFGNEPDLFRTGIRKSNYNSADYVAEWREFFKALRTRVPSVSLAGPDIAFDISWLPPFIHAFGSEVAFLTCHYYAEGPASSSDVTMNRMLGSGEALAKIIDSVARYTAESGLKVRMAESNSVYGGGKSGISDTLGAALWGVDVMFTLAEARWLGINFHGGGGGYYSPIAQTSSGAFEPKPLYYAMLLFAYAGRGSLVPIHTRRIRPWLRAFAVRGTGGEHRVVLINKDLAQNGHVRLAASGQKATILRLTPDSAESKSGLAFGGASVDPNGDWAPQVAESVTLKSDRFVVDMPAASAAVVEIYNE